MDNVIILMPVHNADRTLEACLHCLDQLDPQPSKYVFVENNSADRTLKIIQGWNRPKELIRCHFSKDALRTLKPTRKVKGAVDGDPWAVIAIARQILLKRARQLDPDFAIFLDSDVFIMNPDLIERITSWQKAIVAAGILRKIGTKGIILERGRKRIVTLEERTIWNCWTDSSHQVQEDFYGLQNPHMVDLECTCLSRKVVQDTRINFYPIEIDDVGEDAAYMLKTKRVGHEHFLDCTLKVRHAEKLGFHRHPWTKIEGKFIHYEFQ